MAFQLVSGLIGSLEGEFRPSDFTAVASNRPGEPRQQRVRIQRENGDFGTTTALGSPGERDKDRVETVLCHILAFPSVYAPIYMQTEDLKRSSPQFSERFLSLFTWLICIYISDLGGKYSSVGKSSK